MYPGIYDISDMLALYSGTLLVMFSHNAVIRCFMRHLGNKVIIHVSSRLAMFVIHMYFEMNVFLCKEAIHSVAIGVTSS